MNAIAVGIFLGVALQTISKLAPVKKPFPLDFPPLRPLNTTSTLSRVERFFEEDPLFTGPESFVFNNDGSFYTGLANGDIGKKP